MTGTVFVDTNVLVYVRGRTDEEKQRQAASWMAALWESRRGRLSYQVLQEYYVTVTSKLDPPRDGLDGPGTLRRTCSGPDGAEGPDRYRLRSAFNLA